MIISAGAADVQNGRDADDSPLPSKAKVSAFHTRNAVLVFAVFGLLLVLIDTVLHVTRLINRCPAVFDIAVSNETTMGRRTIVSSQTVVHRGDARSRRHLLHSRVRAGHEIEHAAVLSLRCCSAAWEQKMRDTVGMDGTLKRKGAAGSAAVRIRRARAIP